VSSVVVAWQRLQQWLLPCSSPLLMAASFQLRILAQTTSKSSVHRLSTDNWTPKVKVKVTLWLAVYRQAPWDSLPEFLFQLNPCGNSPYVTTSSLTRRWGSLTNMLGLSSSELNSQADALVIQPICTDRKSSSIVTRVSVGAGKCLPIRSIAAAVCSCLLKICCLASNIVSLFPGRYPATALYATIFFC
jgi:hypothetical protein